MLRVSGKKRFRCPNKSIDRADLESQERRLEGWDCHVAVLIVGEYGIENKSSGKCSPQE